MENSDQEPKTESPLDKILEGRTLKILERDSFARLEGEGGFDVAEHPETASRETDTGLRQALSRIDELEHELGVARLSLSVASLKVEDLKQTEIELKRAGDYAKAIVEDVPPLLILDQELRVITANTSFYSHFQVSPAQTENFLIYQLGNGQWDIPRLRVLLEEILPRNSFFRDFELTHEFPALGKRTIVLSGRRVDHLQRILVNIEDVTERLHFQVALRRSERRYRRLFEAAKDGILIVDPGTRRIIDCNPFIQELVDYERHELLGKELWEIGLLKDEAANRQAFAELQTKRYIRYEDLPLQTRSGLHREVEFVSNLYYDNESEVIQCNVRDISARKMTERALAAAKDEISRHAAELEAHVAERTARLRETIGELEMFSYSVAHDMRAPLRAMEGFAQLLLEDSGKDLAPEARERVAYITAAAARMDMLIQDVLTYTTIPYNEMKTSVVDLDTLIRQVIQTYPQLHTGDGQIVIEGFLPKVFGHPAAISQGISNLLTNAVKFVGPGVSPRVKVRAQELPSYIRVWVEDNGIGIAPEDHKRIFTMFERVNNDYEGTGMGLTIVRKSMERLRGNVGLESALGAGSKFWLDFRKIR